MFNFAKIHAHSHKFIMAGLTAIPAINFFTHLTHTEWAWMIVLFLLSLEGTHHAVNHSVKDGARVFITNLLVESITAALNLMFFSIGVVIISTAISLTPVVKNTRMVRKLADDKREIIRRIIK